jgi:sporulation protein YabP
MMTERKEMNEQKHEICMKGREVLDVRGVTDVLRFDEESVVLSTVCGTLTVEGTSLHVKALDPTAGTATVDGRIDAFFYTDGENDAKGNRRGFLSRLFG